ncbi:hypothetical protein ACFFJI_04410 [Allobacillus sp. GCM10007491]|uniref:Uncharacterized protein n=1 Tax=Allobacillus saliphilus TaxID=2912308 RepID=A0A941CVQ3_9BACI|nr:MULTISPECIES: hypothetical protein [Allobacillus]MBR7554867.1 hypothetical protein [Allobacillus saliphilus]
MSDREFRCRACDGDGLLMDDENWQYTCTVCDGIGFESSTSQRKMNEVADVDENNRILD